MLKFAMISFIFLSMLVVSQAHVAGDNKPIEAIDQNSLRLASQSPINVEFGLLKIANDSVVSFGVYQDAQDQVVFIKRQSVVNVENVQFQFYDFSENQSKTQAIVRTKDYDSFNASENKYYGLVEKEYTLYFSEGFAFVNIEMQPAEEQRVVIVKYEDIQFVFYHLSKPSNLPFQEEFTIGEFYSQLFLFGASSVVVAIIALAMGYAVNRKAKEIPIPTWVKFTALPLLSFIAGLGATLKALLGDMIINQGFYFAAVAVISFVIGIQMYHAEFIEYLGILRKYERGREKISLYFAKLYRPTHKDNAQYAIALGGMAEAIRRFFGFHTMFVLDSQYSLDVEGYTRAYELEDVGRRRDEDGRRIFEWVTVSYHKLPTRIVSDLYDRINLYEDAMRDLENEINDLKSNQETEFHRRLALAMESLNAKMGVNLYRMGAISKETLELARAITDNDQFEQDLQEDVNQIEKNGFHSKLAKKLRRFT